MPIDVIWQQTTQDATLQVFMKELHSGDGTYTEINTLLAGRYSMSLVKTRTVSKSGL